MSGGRGGFASARARKSFAPGRAPRRGSEEATPRRGSGGGSGEGRGGEEGRFWGGAGHLKKKNGGERNADRRPRRRTRLAPARCRRVMMSRLSYRSRTLL